MRWKKKDYERWHPWFAWRPVVVDGAGGLYVDKHWCWLEWVKRRQAVLRVPLEYASPFLPPLRWWEYWMEGGTEPYRIQLDE